MNRLKRILGNLKQWFLYRVICRLFPPEKWLNDWLRKNGGAIKLENNTWIVHQSEKFYNYCYSKGYDDFSNGI